jgi:predicted phosphodiesterase
MGVGKTYGLLSDLHLTRRPPASCTDSYLPDLLGLLKQAFAVFREREVDAAVIAGDLLHHKAPSRTDHGLVQVLAKGFRTQPFPVWVVPGNHDLSHDRIESLRTQPLGVLFATEAAHCLDGWMGGERPVFGVPWQQHWSADRIAECLRPYREQVYEAGLGNQRPLVVTHAPIYPPSSEPRYPDAELTPADWWADALEAGRGQHSVFYGHIHEHHGTWERRGVRFCNNGALSRGSLGEDNLTRQVGVTLWDSETGEFEFVPLDAKPAEQVFRLKEHERAVDTKMSLDGFLTELGTTTLRRVSPESVMAHVATLDVPREVASRVEELLHWANAGGGR